MAGTGEERGGVVDRARRDVADGRLWKARDRLASVAREQPPDQEVLALLGEVHFRMGDHPAAWRYWALTGAEGPDADVAEAAFAQRYGDDLANRLGQIPAREPLEQYPEEARERLLRLRAEAQAAGIVWPRSQRSLDGHEYEDEEEGCSGCALLALVLFVVPWFAGLAALVYLLIGAL